MYTEYFGLREPPFQVAPDPRFFYGTPAYQEALASLVAGIRQRKGFGLLTGEVGTGKTTLLRRLIESLGPNIPFVFVFNTRLSFDEILSFVCDELGLKADGPERVRKIQALNRFLLDQLRRGGTTALLVDEGQDLSDDALEDLRLLSNLETSGEKLLQIVLVGQPELEEKLSQPKLRQLRQRIAFHRQLDRLKTREVDRFIAHRLNVAGYRGSILFPHEAVVAIARFSRGVPRVVNQICDNALLLCYATQQRTVTTAIVDEVLEELGLRGAPADAEAAPLELDRALRQVGERAQKVGETAQRGRETPAPRGARTDRGSFWLGVCVLALLVTIATGVLASRDGIMSALAWEPMARFAASLRTAGPKPSMSGAPLLTLGVEPAAAKPSGEKPLMVGPPLPETTLPRPEKSPTPAVSGVRPGERVASAQSGRRGNDRGRRRGPAARVSHNGRRSRIPAPTPPAAAESRPRESEESGSWFDWLRPGTGDQTPAPSRTPRYGILGKSRPGTSKRLDHGRAPGAAPPADRDAAAQGLAPNTAAWSGASSSQGPSEPFCTTQRSTFSPSWRRPEAARLLRSAP